MRSSPGAAFLAPSFEKIGQLAGLASDWDSYGGAPPSPVAVGRAQELLRELTSQYGAQAGQHLRPFTIAPLANGGIQFEWRSENGDIEVEVCSDGSLAYLLIEGHGDARTFCERHNASWREVIRLVGQIVLRKVQPLAS